MTDKTGDGVDDTEVAAVDCAEAGHDFTVDGPGYRACSRPGCRERRKVEGAA